MSAEVFPIEPGRWVAVIDDHDLSTEASSPHEVADEVRSAVREVLGWQDVNVELHDDVGRPWSPADAPAQASRMGIDQGLGGRAARRADDEIVFDVVEWATARGAWAADGVHLSREHVLALAEEIRPEAITMLRIDPVAEGAAAVEVLISDDDVLVSIGIGGRYELDIDDEDLPVLAAQLEAVAAGRYVEDIRVGASRYETTLADGRTMKGSEQDLLWSLRWGRQHLTYQAY